jgi:hypothetical protein
MIQINPIVAVKEINEPIDETTFQAKYASG